MKHGSFSPVVLAVLALIALVATLALPPPPAEAATLNLTASLDGPQASKTCSQGSAGTGSAAVTLDTVTNLLSWQITFSGLSGSPSGAHFHGPAAAGVNAGIQVGIGDVISPSVGSATITDTQETDLLNGLWYINYHTVKCGGGEIRGQVTQAVGGIAELPEVAGTPLGEPGSSDGNLGVLLAIVAGAAAGALGLGAGAWFVVRRYLS